MPTSDTALALTGAEWNELADLEEKIEAGLATYIEVGMALRRIRDGRLYRDSHGTFEAYCSERWQRGRAWAYEMIGFAEVRAEMSAMADITGETVPLPSNPRQVRALKGADPEERNDVAREAAARDADGELTAANIAAVIAERNVPAAQPETEDDRAKALLAQFGPKAIADAHKKHRAEKEAKNRAERIERIETIARGNRPLHFDTSFSVIMADPPWRYEFSSDNADSIENHYPTMDTSEICALPVDAVAAPDAILFLWTTSPKLPEALGVIEAWGFDYRTCAVWDKQHLGMGYYFRQQHELLLVATRGNIPVPAPADRPRSLYSEQKGAHSVKPAAFAEMVERMYPTLPKLEMFCRSPREGWTAWGNEVEAEEVVA